MLKILPVFILVLPGLIARALWPGEDTGDTAFPLLVERLLVPGLSGLMIAALLAALMSSLRSVLNSCSTLVTMDIYRKLRLGGSEKRLVLVGRDITGCVVLPCILWIPMVGYLSGEVFQWMQSVQAYIGAPITATFLPGILWRGRTSRAAMTTLVVGGLAGGGRFALDILYEAHGMDLRPLTSLVQMPFLNFSVGGFFGCLGLFCVTGKLDEKPALPRVVQLTVDWSGRRKEQEEAGDDKFLGGVSLLVGLAVPMLWIHFR